MARHIYLGLIAVVSLVVIVGESTMLNSPALAKSEVISPTLQGRGIIMGIVFDPSGRPVEKARVELLDDVYSVLASVRTTGTGQFSFKGLSAGAFNIRVNVETGEYAEQMQRIELVSFSRSGQGTASPSSEMRQVDFYLRPKNVRGATSPAGVVFSQNIPDEAKKSYTKAVSDLENKKADEGVAGLKAALKVFPDYYLALTRLGEAQINNAKFEEARDVLSRAVKINAKGYEGFYWLGIAQVGLKQLPEAVESFRQALSHNPTSLNSVMWLGMALRRNGKLDEAETQLKKAKQMAGGKPIPQAHWELALLYNHQKRNKEAADELELFLKAQPDSRDAESIKKLIKQLREKANEKAKS